MIIGTNEGMGVSGMLSRSPSHEPWTVHAITP